MDASHDRNRAQRGSVLAPVVAAMLILTISGAMLSELFASQRMSSVSAIESAQAHWAGEGAIWHAAYEESSLPSGIALGGSTYTVVKNGDDYTVSSQRNTTTRELSANVAGSVRLITSGAPLHDSVSASTAYTHQGNHFHVSLASIHADDAVIAGFRVLSGGAVPELTQLRLGGNQIWSDVSGTAVPTTVQALNSGTTADRTVASNSTTDLMLTFESDVTPGDILIWVGLFYTNGTSSSLLMTLSW